MREWVIEVSMQYFQPGGDPDHWTLPFWHGNDANNPIHLLALETAIQWINLHLPDHPSGPYTYNAQYLRLRNILTGEIIPGMLVKTNEDPSS